MWVRVDSYAEPSGKHCQWGDITGLKQFSVTRVLRVRIERLNLWQGGDSVTI